MGVGVRVRCGTMATSCDQKDRGDGCRECCEYDLERGRRPCHGLRRAIAPIAVAGFAAPLRLAAPVSSQGPTRGRTPREEVRVTTLQQRALARAPLWGGPSAARSASALHRHAGLASI